MHQDIPKMRTYRLCRRKLRLGNIETSFILPSARLFCTNITIFALKITLVARILAIDYGRKRTGIAVTDPLQIIAGGLTTVETSRLLPFIKEYVGREDVETIVVGLPRTVKGEYSESFGYIAPFVERLRSQLPGVEVVYHDERFTTKMAMRSMITAGATRSQRNNKSGVVDMVSAAIILQSYMDSKK